MKIPLDRRIFESNDAAAEANAKLFAELGLHVINMMASPGAGKTSLVIRTIEALRERLRIAVIEGDLASRIDADRVAETGVPVVQINTDGGCHLDAREVRKVLDQLPVDALDLLIIENVGNLVCPAGFELGERTKIVVASTPEGDDKPLKYPGMFSLVDVVVLNKMDLVPHLNFDVDRFKEYLAGLNAAAALFCTSCTTGEGIDDWAAWLESAAAG